MLVTVAPLSVSRELAAVRLPRILSTDARESKTWSWDEAADMATPRSCACARDHAAELLKKPDELGLRTELRSRAAQKTLTGVAGETTQGRATDCRLRRGARGRRESRSGATGHVATCTPTLNRSVALDRLASHYIALRQLAFHSIGLQCLVLRPLTSYCQTEHCSRCVCYQHARYALCGLVPQNRSFPARRV